MSLWHNIINKLSLYVYIYHETDLYDYPIIFKVKVFPLAYP